MAADRLTLRIQQLNCLQNPYLNPSKNIYCVADTIGAVTDDPQSDEHVQSCKCVPDEQQRIFMRAEDQYVVGCLDEVEKYEEQVGFDDE